MRNTTIMYAIDMDTGLVISRVGDQYAWPILDFEGMKPENDFEMVYNLEKVPVHSTCDERLKHTRKISLEQKNFHREFWGMKKVKPSPKYCPLCGEYWKKDICNK